MKPISHTDLQFLELLKAGIWGIAPAPSLFSNTDWEAVMAQARRQAVSPLVFDGLERLPKDFQPSQQLKFQWYSDVVQVERKNENINKTVVKLVQRFSDAGIKGIIIKGQSLTHYYPRPNHRVPGDVDIYFPKGYAEANALAQRWTPRINEEDLAEQDWRHQFGYLLPNGVMVENHRECALYFSRQRMAIWKDVELRTMGEAHGHFLIGDTPIPTLSPTLNAIFVFQHLLRHLLFFGVGFRQVCDWILLFKHELPNIDRTLFFESIDRLELRRSMTALTLVAERYLGLEKGVFPFDTSTAQAQEDADIMFREILRTGNFGQDTTLLKGKESNNIFRKLHAYVLLFKSFFVVSRFGSREVFGVLRNMSGLYVKKSLRFLLRQKGK